MQSRASAEAIAMKLCCETGGGETCHLEIAYDNECAAIAWGDHYYKTAYAETLDEASHLALDACGRQTDHCKVFYANCSYPVKLR